MTAPLPWDALAKALGVTVQKVTVPATEHEPAREVIQAVGLPAGVVDPNGNVDIGAQVAMLTAAVQRLRQLRLRSVHGQVVLTAGTIAVGTPREVPVTWSAVPDAPVEAALARMDVGVAWQGRVTAAIKDGSITTSGCTVVVTAVGLTAVVITTALPLTVHADGLYNFLPPYEGA